MIRSGLIQLLSSYLVGVTLACQGAKIMRSGGLSCWEKDSIIRWHNERRSEVATGNVNGQPRAQNMMEMCWDEELANNAQDWADNCVFEHDKGRSHSTHLYVGQNMYKSWSSPHYDQTGSAPDFKRAIDSWFIEVKNYGYNGRFRKETGHYSQLIWGDSHLVGCGFTSFKNGSTYSKFYVCNYLPGGNYDRPPYAYGSQNCRHYGLFPSTKHSGLCFYKGCPSTCH
ncbi:scoloptoxin SSD976 [Halyomorpha halys]|uniref:scoloptoxin SSD976 n=1 Tax=Halyomorpha halys TaxID=286706 RepID=UPI0006D51C68|nr:CRISP/Allergen/PR-1-like [Halyomorpha halys]XP_014293837.1 CRISP/Allergen/PR-1-like [Halyomorpha halys]